jgi:hypothetical protein
MISYDDFVAKLDKLEENKSSLDISRMPHSKVQAYPQPLYNPLANHHSALLFAIIVYIYRS